MKVKIIKFGKPAFKEYDSLCENYSKRLQNGMKLETELLRTSDAKKVLESENKILESSDSTQRIIALDERGKSFKSTEFAAKLSDWQMEGQIKTVTFVIGGPYGLSDAFKEHCHELWRLSDFVVTSDLAWLLITEQIYRAYTSQNGTSYHHE